MNIATLEHKGQHSTAWHQHESGQLFWLSQGLIIIETEQTQWVVTPGSIGWFPANLRHCAQMIGTVTRKCLYLNAADCGAFPPHSGVFGADGFIFALLERLCQSSLLSSQADYQAALLKVLTCEITQWDALPLHLTLPTDRRARNVANELLNQPSITLSQAVLAKKWGVSIRNLSRLFHQETGLSFSRWRQQAKVLSSLQWVFADLPVNEVAYLSGYSNVSAYIEAFRQRFGKTPGQLKAASNGENR